MPITPEQTALRKKIANINLAIAGIANLQVFGDFLCQNDLVPQQTVSNILGTNGIDNLTKVSKLMNAVQTQITTATPADAARYYKKFVLLVRNNLELTNLAIQMVETCKECYDECNLPYSPPFPLGHSAAVHQATGAGNTGAQNQAGIQQENVQKKGTDPSLQADSSSANGASPPDKGQEEATSTDESEDELQIGAKTSPAIKVKDGGSATKEHPAKVEAGLEVCFSDWELATPPETDPKYFKKFIPNLKDAHEMKIKGEGIKLAIIDFFDGRLPKDGIQRNHKALSKARLDIKIISKSDKHNPTDHALFCTAIAIGSFYEKAFYVSKNGKPQSIDYPGGIAPEADTTLFLIKSGCKESLLDALDQVAKKKFDVLSMSIGCQGEWMKEKIKKIHSNGTIIVAATGNGGIWDGILQPALFEDVIGVESFDTFGKPSAFAAKGDIAFPGEIMVPACDEATGKLVQFVTGTSMAAPGIAGLVCLLLQCAKKYHYRLTKKNILDYLKHMIIIDGRTKFDEKMAKFLVKAFTDKNFLKTIDEWSV